METGCICPIRSRPKASWLDYWFLAKKISKWAEALFLIFGFICLICFGAVKLDRYLGYRAAMKASESIKVPLTP